jgi:hypothetical protein
VVRIRLELFHVVELKFRPVSSQMRERSLDGSWRRKQDRTKNKLHNRAGNCGFHLDIEQEFAIMCVQPDRPQNAATVGEAEHPSRQPDGDTWQRLREEKLPADTAGRSGSPANADAIL